MADGQLVTGWPQLRLPGPEGSTGSQVISCWALAKRDLAVPDGVRERACPLPVVHCSDSVGAGDDTCDWEHVCP